MSDYSKKYTYRIPGLEDYKLEGIQQVWDTLHQIADERYPDMTEDSILDMYETHHDSFLANEIAQKKLEELMNILRVRKHKRFLNRSQIVFNNYTIINNLYAYFFKDHSHFELTVDYINQIKCRQIVYFKISHMILEEYDFKDFEEYLDPYILIMTEAKKELSKLRVEHSRIKAMGKIDEASNKNYKDKSKRLENIIKYPKYKPQYYVREALEKIEHLHTSSLHALGSIIRYHLEQQKEEKKLHNQKYDRQKNRKTVSKTDDIAKWMLKNPGVNSKLRCSQELGIPRSTVIDNWEKANVICRNLGKL